MSSREPLLIKIERPGIDPTWLKTWKSISRDNVGIREMHGPKNIAELEHYARHGQTLTGAEEKYPHPKVSPPYRNWESYLNMELATYGHYLTGELDSKGVAGPSFDTTLAVRIFAATYTSQMINLRLHAKSPLRFPGRTLHWMSFEMLAYTALGVVIGCKEQAFRLARMQLAAYRKGAYDDLRDHYPALHFVLRVLADYLGEPPLVLRGDALTNPIYNALTEAWREPNSEALVPILLVACDEHTKRIHAKMPHRLYWEFLSWIRTPIEILLLFRLRQWLGLSNPHIDHPLMNTPLGVLPPEVAFEPDDLIKRVRARMMQDGYDEEAIFAEVCRESPAGSATPAAAASAGEQRRISPTAPPIPRWSGDVSKLKLREFVSQAFGLVFNAPESWKDTSEGLLFGVHDPQADIQFTASAYAIPVVSVEDWATLRFLTVDSEMPYLKQVLAPYILKGKGWSGIACEYQGTYPNEKFETRYLVLCLKNGEIWISFTLVASAGTFAENEGLYRWLLQNQLTLRKTGKFEKVEL